MTDWLLQPVLSVVGIGVTLGVLSVLLAAWSSVLLEWFECLRR